MDAVFSKSVPKLSFPNLPDPDEKAGRVETLEWPSRRVRLRPDSTQSTGLS